MPPSFAPQSIKLPCLTSYRDLWDLWYVSTGFLSPVCSVEEDGRTYASLALARNLSFLSPMVAFLVSLVQVSSGGEFHLRPLHFSPFLHREILMSSAATCFFSFAHRCDLPQERFFESSDECSPSLPTSLLLSSFVSPPVVNLCYMTASWTASYHHLPPLSSLFFYHRDDRFDSPDFLALPVVQSFPPLPIKGPPIIPRLSPGLFLTGNRRLSPSIFIPTPNLSTLAWYS